MISPIKTAMAIALTVASLGVVFGASTAGAHPVKQAPVAQHLSDEVWVGNELAGKDADENVRRTFGSLGG
jgi:aromatic ring-cleaving dioxygenase